MRTSLLGNTVSGVFTPVLKKHTSRLDLIELLSVGIDKMKRNFEPLKQQINDWQTREVTDDHAKLVIYRAVVEEKFPLKLLTSVHEHYFTPQYEAFLPRTMWSLSNAFTSALKQLAPIRQFQMTAKLGAFLEGV